jgi:hypothetical protein
MLRSQFSAFPGQEEFDVVPFHLIVSQGVTTTLASEVFDNELARCDFANYQAEIL